MTGIGTVGEGGQQHEARCTVFGGSLGEEAGFAGRRAPDRHEDRDAVCNNPQSGFQQLRPFQHVERLSFAELLGKDETMDTRFKL
jgi:hypothetical protein